MYTQQVIVVKDGNVTHLNRLLKDGWEVIFCVSQCVSSGQSYSRAGDMYFTIKIKED